LETKQSQMAATCDQVEEAWSWIKSWEFLGQLYKPNCFIESVT